LASESARQQTPPAWAAFLRRLTTWLVEDAFGGPRPWKFANVINFQKAARSSFSRC
jgi:hypothetical protein